MIKVTELKGRPQVFTLKDGKTTLRVFARKAVEIAEDKVSDEMKRAEKMGLILMTKKDKVQKSVEKGGKE